MIKEYLDISHKKKKEKKRKKKKGKKEKEDKVGKEEIPSMCFADAATTFTR